jgi:tripartite-type tricarboxylate transporter receptor subunit TctC
MPQHPALPRRPVLLGAAAAALAVPGLARAQGGRGPDGWPGGRSISLVLPFAPGGGTDVVARILIDGFTEHFGGSFVMEHKPGATTTVAGRHVARARPDGATLLVGSNSTFAQAPHAFRTLGYDPFTDFTHVSLLFGSAYLLVANPRWGSLQQVLDAARRAPNSVTYASWGVGSTAHLLMLDMNGRTGTEMLHVPFNGPAPALTEILAGRVDLMFTTFAPARAHALEGRLRPIGAPHEQRLAQMPGVPTMIEQGLPDFIVSAWWCFSGPAGLPAPLAAALAGAVRFSLARPAAQRPIEDFGLLPLPLGPEALKARIAQDHRVMGELMRRAGIVPE